MADSLLILYNKTQSAWCVVNDNKITTEIEQGVLSLAANIAKGKKIIVLLDASQCSYFLVDLPARNQRKAISAIPYQLEESLSEDIEQLHFFYQKKTSDNKIGVVVISKTALKEITADLTANKINPNFICPAFTLLEPNTVCISNDLAICHIDQQNQFTCQQELLPTMLEAINIDSSSLNISCLNCEQDDYKNLHPLELLSKNIKNLPYNLLQNNAEKISKIKLFKKWGLTASLLVVLLVIYLFSIQLTTNKVEKQIKDTRETSIKILKKAFPEIKKVRDPRLLMKSKLKQLNQRKNQKNNQLTKLLFDVGSTIKDLAHINIEAINANKNTLEIDIKVSQLKEIEEIKDILINRDGFIVKVSAISQNENGAKGRLIIK